MNSFRKNLLELMRALLLTAIVATVPSCENTFRSDPFHGQVPDYLSGLNAKSIARLTSFNPEMQDTVRIALISDSHYDLDGLQEAAGVINQSNYQLVIHMGDLTQAGLYDEYKAVAEVLADISPPLICIPGNHDYLGSGQYYFGQFFGSPNLSLLTDNLSLILWDNCVWERSSGAVDTKWLSNCLVSSSGRKLVFCHIPPWDPQIVNNYGNLYITLMRQNGIMASVHGHNHDPSVSSPYHDGIPYTIAGSTMKGIFSEITLVDSVITIQTISF